MRIFCTHSPNLRTNSDIGPQGLYPKTSLLVGNAVDLPKCEGKVSCTAGLFVGISCRKQLHCVVNIIRCHGIHGRRDLSSAAFAYTPAPCDPFFPPGFRTGLPPWMKVCRALQSWSPLTTMRHPLQVHERNHGRGFAGLWLVAMVA